jgi:riboflavin synthase
MFTGIIECLGVVRDIEQQNENLIFKIESPLSNELKIDQSVAHDGVCLTVVEIEENMHKVVAIFETLKRSNLQTWKTGTLINLERAMISGGRLDGHMVQGHVDTVAICTHKSDQGGSWLYTFEFQNAENQGLLVDKGSVCINGTSLTVVNPDDNKFSVAIIPYTFEHTNIHNVSPGVAVNVEFDILGKYIQRQIQHYLPELTKLNS